ncbi:MAG: O-antigen ligase family protein [Bacteroidota bacterium]
MRSKALVLNLFPVGVLISSMVYSSSILDFTLTPRLIGIASILLFCIFLIWRSKEILSIKSDLILIAYAGFVVFSCLSTAWAHTRSEAIFENSKIVMSFLVFVLGYYALKKDKDHTLIMLCRVAMLLTLGEAVLISLQLSHLTAFNKEALYSVTGANSHKNLVSSFLFINLFFLIIGCIRMQKIWRYLSLTAVVLNLCMILIIQTKAVWIALALVLLLSGALFAYKRLNIRLSFKWTLVIIMILANVFFAFVQPKIIERGLAFNRSQIEANQYSGKTELDNERLELWNKTYYMIRHHPVIGVGSGNWQIYFPDATLQGMYRAEDLNYTFQRPHNDILWIIAETGFIGFNLFLLFICSILILLLNAIQLLGDQKKTVIELVLCFVTIVGFLTASFFDFPKERIEHLIWINLVFALAYFYAKENISLKTIATFKLNHLHFIAVIGLSAAVIYIGSYRYKGEYHTRKMYDQKRLSNNTGVIQEGKKAINFVYTIDPTSLPIKWYTGNSFALQGNFRQSKLDFMEAYDLNPFNRNVLNDLASAYVNTNEIDLAKKHYLEACRISPRFDDAKLNLTTIYFNQKEFEKADSILKTLLHDSERRTKYQAMVNAFLGK